MPLSPGARAGPLVTGGGDARLSASTCPAGREEGPEALAATGRPLLASPARPRRLIPPRRAPYLPATAGSPLSQGGREGGRGRPLSRGSRPRTPTPLPSSLPERRPVPVCLPGQLYLKMRRKNTVSRSSGRGSASIVERNARVLTFQGKARNRGDLFPAFPSAPAAP